MLQVLLENPPGTVLSTRQFTPGQELRVGAHLTDTIGLPGGFVTVRFELFDSNFSPLFNETVSNVFGNAWVDWILPTAITKATIRVTVLWIGSPEVLDLPIGIGEAPPPVPVPGDMSWLWALLIAGVVVASTFAYSKGKS